MGNNIPRRHHYVPQKYLDGFSNSSSIVWVCNKQDNKVFAASSSKIAVERDYYTIGNGDMSLEEFFSDEIESPANPILDKILKREKIDKKEKQVIAIYAYSMIKRGPAGKKRVKQILPNIVDTALLQKIDQHVEKNYSEEKTDLLKEHARKFMASQVENPSNIFLKPDSLEIPNTIMQMKWYFLYTKENHFLTCDNPFFFHTTQGLQSGEFTFPVGKSMALWGTTEMHGPDCSYHKAKLRTLREINRRTIKNAIQHIYSTNQDNWITKTVRKRNLKEEKKLPF